MAEQLIRLVTLRPCQGFFGRPIDDRQAVTQLSTQVSAPVVGAVRSEVRLGEPKMTPETFLANLSPDDRQELRRIESKFGRSTVTDWLLQWSSQRADLEYLAEKTDFDASAWAFVRDEAAKREGVRLSSRT
jgi:hypothetical protein